MPATFEPIATTTLSSAASTITFSSISGTYTDLRLVWISPGSSNVYGRPNVQLNSDTGTNYSYTTLDGDGTNAGSARGADATFIRATRNYPGSTTAINFVTYDFFSYANTSINKTVLATWSNDQNGSGETAVTVNLWRSTAAINRIDIIHPSGGAATFSAGTTATLYGILKA